VISRKQVIVRSLAAGVLAGIGVSAYLVWKQLGGPPPPQYPLSLPARVSWANRSVTLMPDKTVRSLVEAFVGDGRNFRLEVAITGKPPVIWIYDGRALTVNVKVPEKPYNEIDPRNTILGLYGTLPSFKYRGVKSVGDHACWAFERRVEGARSRIWVDVKTVTPRQVMLSYPDGRTDTQTYVDLPTHRTRQPGLFDPTHLNPMLIPSAEAMLQN